jgi:3-hydroxyisobutyrate dehydrogenase-like beta-hydroxyacid dehydrogenase
MTNSIRLAFIGYGEVGKLFARQFLARGGVTIAVYDILFDDSGRGPAMIAAAKAAGLRVARDAQEAAVHADIVFSAVTAAAAGDVAACAAAYLKPGQVFFDINSASPATKCDAAAKVSPSGAHYIEGAVMAAVAGPGIRVPILAGGPQAAAAAPRLNAIGMNVRAVSAEPGRASAMKLCRSIVIKGLEVLMVDCAAAARKWGVDDEVFASLHETFPSVDFAEMAEYMAERVGSHGIRRAAEMREAAMMLADLGLNPELATAIADSQARGAQAAAARKAAAE